MLRQRGGFGAEGGEAAGGGGRAQAGAPGEPQLVFFRVSGGGDENGSGAPTPDGGVVWGGEDCEAGRGPSLAAGADPRLNIDRSRQLWATPGATPTCSTKAPLPNSPHDGPGGSSRHPGTAKHRRYGTPEWARRDGRGGATSRRGGDRNDSRPETGQASSFYQRRGGRAAATSIRSWRGAATRGVAGSPGAPPLSGRRGSAGPSFGPLRSSHRRAAERTAAPSTPAASRSTATRFPRERTPAPFTRRRLPGVAGRYLRPGLKLGLRPGAGLERSASGR